MVSKQPPHPLSALVVVVWTLDNNATEGAKKERKNRNREETGKRKRGRKRPSRGRVGGVFRVERIRAKGGG